MAFSRSKKGWPILVQGDQVDLVAPGFRCSDEELKGAVDFIESLGLKACVPKDLFRGHTLFSNSDEYRYQHLASSLKSSESKAVWCLRGGYGSLRLLPKLKRLKAPRTPKVFLGYSDITSLHIFLNQSWGWSTLHSPVLDRFGGGRSKPLELKEIQNILFGAKRTQEFANLKPLNELAKKRFKMEASVEGGNLAVLQSSLGTPYQVQLKGRILFLEDIGERPHRLDRMLTHLVHSGVLSGVRAILFGDMVLSDTLERRKIWAEVVHRFAKSQNVPMFRGLKVGHGPAQRILPLNTRSVLKGGSRPTLTLETGGN
ncbi:LD-carboxypeptidase [bacterium]|nr:LD-carboxypeptidase [bacterium]